MAYAAVRCGAHNTDRLLADLRSDPLSVSAAMTIEEANALQSEWGNQPCGHPDIIAEKQPEGVFHDNWRCTQCGGLVDYDGWRRLSDPRD